MTESKLTIRIRAVDDGATQQVAAATEGMQQLGLAAGAVGAGITAVFTQGTRAFVEFDNAIRTSAVVQRAVGTPEIAALREEVERLGIETSKAPADIAQLSVSLSRAGFAAEQQIASLQGIVQASEATGTSLIDVGDIVGQALKAFQLEASETGRVVDLLVTSANNANVTIPGIGEALSFSSSAAAQANQSLEESLLFISLLGEVGIQGSSAGTAFAEALRRLALTSAQAQTEISELKGGSEAAVNAFNLLQAEVRDANGQLLPISEIVPRINRALETLGQGDQEVLANAIFGVRGGRGFLSVAAQAEGKLIELSQQLQESEGAAREAGEAVLQGLGGSLDLLGGSVGAVQVKFGEFASQGIEPVVRSAITLLNSFLELDPSLQRILIATTALTGVYAGAVAAIAAYNALNVAAAIQQAKLALATANQTIVLGANTVAKLANASAGGVLSAGISALSGAFTATTGAIAANTAAFATAAGVVAAAVAAFEAVRQVLSRSEGAEFAAGIRDASDSLAEARGELSLTSEEAEGLSGSLERIRQEFSEGNLFDRLIEGLQAAAQEFQRLGDGIPGVEVESDRFGNTISVLGNEIEVFGRSLGVVTREQRGLQLATLETEAALDSLAPTLDRGRQLFLDFGIDASSALDPTRAEEFAQASEPIAEALQEEIALLKEQQRLAEQAGASTDSIQIEIQARESQVRAIEKTISATQEEADTLSSVENSYESLGTVLDEIAARRDRLAAATEATLATELAGIAERELTAISQGVDAEAAAAVASLERAQAEIESTSATIGSLQAGLAELRQRQSLGAEGDDPAEIAAEIIRAETEIARQREALASQRIAEIEQQRQQQASLAAEFAEAQEAQLRAIDEASDTRIAAIEASEEAQLIVLRQSEASQEQIRRAGLASEIRIIEEKIRAEEQRAEALTASGGPIEKINEAERARNQLALDLLDKREEAERALADQILAQEREQLAAFEDLQGRRIDSFNRQAQALERASSAFSQDNRIFDERVSLQDRLEAAADRQFEIQLEIARSQQEAAQTDQQRENIANRISDIEGARAEAQRVAQQREEALARTRLEIAERQLVLESRIEQARVQTEIASAKLQAAQEAADVRALEAQAAQGVRIDPLQLAREAQEAALAADVVEAQEARLAQLGDALDAGLATLDFEAQVLQAEQQAESFNRQRQEILDNEGLLQEERDRQIQALSDQVAAAQLSLPEIDLSGPAGLGRGRKGGISTVTGSSREIAASLSGAGNLIELPGVPEVRVSPPDNLPATGGQVAAAAGAESVAVLQRIESLLQEQGAGSTINIGAVNNTVDQNFSGTGTSEAADQAGLVTVDALNQALDTAARQLR